MTEAEFSKALKELQDRFQQDGLSEEEMQLLQQELNELYRAPCMPLPRGMGLRQRLRSRSPAVRGKEASIDRIVQRYLAR